ncbi:unnamed protein product [Tuwongella immobilis]|uniref:Uncharacterized protein n=1 Tax=Tuwongella immobilis TaxID=692036 RepID=A0A6C2YT42_9BACT|nr:unnamed protein product [Tuwongella immobilis]VTS05471.1 unnamed protein product [Tuwongella immobilis]
MRLTKTQTKIAIIATALFVDLSILMHQPWIVNAVTPFVPGDPDVRVTSVRFPDGRIETNPRILNLFQQMFIQSKSVSELLASGEFDYTCSSTPVSVVVAFDDGASTRIRIRFATHHRVVEWIPIPRVFPSLDAPQRYLVVHHREIYQALQKLIGR